MIAATYHFDEDYFYKVEGTKTTIVCAYDSLIRVEIVNNEALAIDSKNFKPITKHEFNHACAQALQLLNEKIFEK